MNYFKEAEKVLAHRKSMEQSLVNLKSRKSRIIYNGAPQGLSGMDYSKPYTTGGAVNDTLEDCLDLIEVQKEITDTESKIKEIDDVLLQLSERDRQMLSLWYIENLSKEYICEKMNVSSPKSVYNIRNSAVGEFSILYFGAGALQTI